MRKTNSGDSAEFTRRIREIIVQAGGRTDIDTSIYEYNIPVTKAGPLFVSVHESHDRSDVGWVACRFLYPELAAEVIGGERLNHYSGKWNHRFFSPTTVDQAVENFERSLSRVLLPVNADERSRA